VVNSESYDSVLPDTFQSPCVTILRPGRKRSLAVPNEKDGTELICEAAKQTFVNISAGGVVDVLRYRGDFSDALSRGTVITKLVLEGVPDAFNILVVISDMKTERHDQIGQLLGWLTRTFVLVVTPTEDEDARNWGHLLNDEYGSHSPQGRRLQVISVTDLADPDKAYEQIVPWLEQITAEATES